MTGHRALTYIHGSLVLFPVSIFFLFVELYLNIQVF